MVVAHTFNPNPEEFYYFLFLLWTLEMSGGSLPHIYNKNPSPQLHLVLTVLTSKMCSLLQAQHSCHAGNQLLLDWIRSLFHRRELTTVSLNLVK